MKENNIRWVGKARRRGEMAIQDNDATLPPKGHDVERRLNEPGRQGGQRVTLVNQPATLPYLTINDLGILFDSLVERI